MRGSELEHGHCRGKLPSKLEVRALGFIDGLGSAGDSQSLAVPGSDSAPTSL